MKHSRRRAFIKCGKCSMCTYDRFKVHKMLYPKMHSKPTTQTCKGCTIPIGTNSMAVYLPEPYCWISCKLCLSAKSTPFHWLLICFIGASPDWPISLVHQPAMTLNVTRTCMKPCNIPLSLGPKKRKGTPWFNAAFTCHVLRVLVVLANSSNRGRKKVKTKRLWCHAVLYKCSICIYKTFRLLHVVVTMHDVDSGHSL